VHILRQSVVRKLCSADDSARQVLEGMADEYRQQAERAEREQALAQPPQT